MKINHLLICFLIIVIIKTTNSQTYYPLPTQNAYWTVYEWDENRLVYDDIVYTVDGDTLLNNLQYTKVYKLNDYPTVFDTIRTLHCFMRQDNEAKKIWFIRHYLGETTEKLGYDLSVAIGDTVSLPAFDYGNAGDSIYIRNENPSGDSVKINDGTYRREYFLHPANYGDNIIQFIEGVTNYTTTFPNKLYLFDPFHQSYTQCVEIYNNFIWPFSLDSAGCGFNLVGINCTEKWAINIYPNPANNYVNVDLPASFKLISCELFDLFGNQIKKINFQISSSLIHFDLSTYSPGVYIIVTKSLTNTYYKKLIINH